jgi:predicted metal-dependent phosphoesterase TrpH
MTPVEAVELILKSSGLPVLAHPTTVGDPERLIIDLKAAGLVGMEVHYKDYSEMQIERLGELARRYNLIATGGTDYHGIENNNEIMLGGTDVPIGAAEQLIALAGKRVLKLADL